MKVRSRNFGNNKEWSVGFSTICTCVEQIKKYMQQKRALATKTQCLNPPESLSSPKKAGGEEG